MSHFDGRSVFSRETGEETGYLLTESKLQVTLGRLMLSIDDMRDGESLLLDRKGKDKRDDALTLKVWMDFE